MQNLHEKKSSNNIVFGPNFPLLYNSQDKKYNFQKYGIGIF